MAISFIELYGSGWVCKVLITLQEFIDVPRPVGAISVSHRILSENPYGTYQKYDMIRKSH